MGSKKNIVLFMQICHTLDYTPKHLTVVLLFYIRVCVCVYMYIYNICVDYHIYEWMLSFFLFNLYTYEYKLIYIMMSVHMRVFKFYV